MDHSHDHDHPHDQGGGHSHDHDHAHAHDDGEYYLNQLLTVFICGAFGVLAVLLYQTLGNTNGGMMGKLLAPAFQLPVLIGGIALLVVVAVRGVCLWQSAGAGHHDHAHGHDGHDHKPGEQCDHPDHDRAADGHGDHAAEDHEHGNVYWRVVILAFPIFLFLMGVPSKGFSARWIKEYLGEEEALRYSDMIVADSGREPVYDFRSLNELSKTDESRNTLIGTRAKLKGQFAPVSGREFSLVFLKMTCCANDKEPLRARILVPEDSMISAYTQLAYPWVQVNGIISEFVKSPKTGEWVAIIRIDRNDGVSPTEPIN